MKKFVRIMAIVLALVCALSLVSCFGDDSSKDKGKETSKKETTSSVGNQNANQNGNNVADNGPCVTHTYGEWTVTQQPNCKYNGLKSRTCTKCATVENQQIQKTGHTFGEYVNLKTATCDEAGSRKHTCTVCNFSETETVAALGHNYGTNNKCTLCNDNRYGTPGLLFTLQRANDPYPDTYKVSRGTSLEKNVVIPAEYNGKPVTYIDAESFCSTEIKSVTIPASVKKIGENAFWDCYELETVEFKSGSQLEVFTGFRSCPKLTSIRIPANVTQVDADCLRGCSALNGVYFDNTEGWYKGYHGMAGSQVADVKDSHQNAITLQYLSNNVYFFRLTENTNVGIK